MDPARGTVEVRACGDTPRAPALTPPAQGLQHLVAFADDPGGALRVQQGRTAAPSGRCVRWTVRVRDRGALWLLPASTWLWHPTTLAPDAEVTVDAVLPSGWALSAPFPEVGAGWRVPPSAWWFEGYLALGRFERTTVDAAGARFEVACVGPEGCVRRLPAQAWLSAAGSAVAQVLGRFPAPRVQVLALDGEAYGEPVSFGLTSRGGGAGVLFTVDTTQPGFAQDWVAVHEFSHLLHPAADEASAWLTEGLATYYQEVLRARAGTVPEALAWEDLVAGFARGREGGGALTLQAESDAMARTHRYQRVYWSGAALCLLADLHLRRETRDRVSLDTLVGALHARGGASTRVWSLAELTQVFEVASEGRWSVVVSPWLAGTAFPAVEPVLASLGVRVRGGVVTLDPAAPEAALRRAVTSPR